MKPASEKAMEYCTRLHGPDRLCDECRQFAIAITDARREAYLDAACAVDDWMRGRGELATVKDAMHAEIMKAMREVCGG